MIRLAAYAAALVIFGDMLARAYRVGAYSFALPLAALCIWLLVLIVRRYRQELRRLRRKNTDFIRPRSFPQQRRRDIR